VCMDHEGDLHTAVGNALDNVELEVLETALDEADKSLNEAAWTRLHDAIIWESQNYCTETAIARLFCIPVLVDVEKAAAMPTEQIHKMLSTFSCKGEHILLIDGWVSISDLAYLTASG